jgi:general secretion pathway protein K
VLKKNSSQGVALVLVIFVIALATIVVVNLTYSTYLAARANIAIERSLYAEYLLKSCVNIAKTYLSADKNINSDGPQEDWAKLFSKGQSIDSKFLDIQDTGNTIISIELIAENRKLVARNLLDDQGTQVNSTKRDILVRLFQNLGFDNDLDELETRWQFNGKHFTSEELVANLIDFMDADDTSYSDPNFVPGVEGMLPKGTFPNKKPTWVSELNSIPGFTPARVRKLEPLITFVGVTSTNVNFAPPIILQSLSSAMTQNEIQQIIEFRDSENGPFSNASAIANIVGGTIWNEINTTVGYSSDYFQVIGKVDLGVKSYFVRSILQRDLQNSLVNVQSIEYF